MGFTLRWVFWFCIDIFSSHGYFVLWLKIFYRYIWLNSFVFLWDSKSGNKNCLWLFYLLVGTYSSYWVSPSRHDMIVHSWYYCRILCYVWLKSLGDLLFFERNCRGWWILGRGEMGKNRNRWGRVNCSWAVILERIFKLFEIKFHNIYIEHCCVYSVIFSAAINMYISRQLCY